MTPLKRPTLETKLDGSLLTTSEMVDVLGEAYGPTGLNTEQGGMRDVFHTEFGMETRIAKVDANPANLSPRLRRMVEDGFNTANDAKKLNEVAASDHPGSAYIANLIDLRYVKDKDLVVTIEEEIKGQRLNEFVGDTFERGEQVSLQDYNSLASKLTLAADCFYTGTDSYFIDWKLENGKVRRVNGELTPFITDSSIARKKSEVKVEELPDMGGRKISDPLLPSSFTGKIRAYGDDSEIFGLCSSLLAIGNGYYKFEVDPEKLSTTVFRNREDEKGESFLDEHGRLDRELYERSLDQAIAELPRAVRRRYGKIIKRGMTLDENLRYDSQTGFLDFRKDVERASKPTFGSGLKKLSKNPLTWLLVGCAAGGAILADQLITPPVQEHLHEQAVVEAAKYPIVGSWDGYGLETVNGFASLGHCISIDRQVGDEHESRKAYPGVTPPYDEWALWDGYIHVDPEQGDYQLKIGFEVSRLIDELGGAPQFTGFVGFIGEDMQTFPITPGRRDRSTLDSKWQKKVDSCKYPEVPIDNLEEGVYTLALGLATPGGPKSEREREGFYSETTFNPNEVIIYDRIPVVVGNPEIKPYLSGLDLDYERGFAIIDLETGGVLSDTNLSFVVSVPDDDYTHIVNDKDRRTFNFPKIEEYSPREFTLTAMYNGKPIYFEAESIRKQDLGYPEHDYWQGAPKDLGFFEDIVEIKQDLYRELNDNSSQ